MQTKAKRPKKQQAPANALGQKTKWQIFKKEFKRDWQLHLLILIPVIYLLIFHYYPMYGAQIAFRSYRARDGITGSEWVGLKWFEKFLTNFRFKEILSNTVALSFYQLLVQFSLSLVLALMFNTIRSPKFKKTVQTITYVPHFISVVVIVAIFNQLFNPISGLYGTLYRLLGIDGYPEDFRAIASSFRHIYVWTGVWQQVGWQTIIFTAALSAVSPDHHEAAMIDGATRWQRVWYVDLPAILPTACTMLIMKCGHVMTVGFEKTYLLQNDLNLTKSEVISTYVYKTAMGTGGDFSYAAAIGLFNSVINCALLIFVNWLSKKLTSDEVGLF